MNATDLIWGQPWMERLGWTLIHFLWQGVLISALYAFARRWLGPRSGPNARYLLACTALATMVAAPLLTYLLMGPSELTPGAAQVSEVRIILGYGSEAAGTAVASSSPARILHPPALPWVVMLWFAGAIAFSLRLMGGWIVVARTRNAFVRPAPPEWQHVLNKLGARIGLTRPARLLVSARVQAPMIIGWLRPVVLLPLGALTGLPPAHVEALLGHELAHIRRQDYLVNILQGIAEALLFYHPAVWWVSGHIRAERELCCDDIAVSISGDVLTYASALAELEAIRPAHSSAVAINSGSLEHRIARLVGESRPVQRALSGTAIIVSALLLVTAVGGMFTDSLSSPRFDAVSLTPHIHDRKDVRLPGLVLIMPGGWLTAQSAFLTNLIQDAYQVKSFEIAGAPDWINTSRYNIEARAAASATPQEMRVMLQALLAERFKLKVHREAKPVPVYTLTAAKGGMKLQETQQGSCYLGWSMPGPPPTPGQPFLPNTPRCGRVEVTFMTAADAFLKGGQVTMPQLTAVLSNLLGRTVIDQTGFSGTFDVDVKFTPQVDFRHDMAWAGVAAAGSIFSAIEEQLGLELEAAETTVEVLVIDQVEKPL